LNEYLWLEPTLQAEIIEQRHRTDHELDGDLGLRASPSNLSVLFSHD
jgi:hypothetical protein